MLEEIRKEAVELSSKQSWIRKGFQDLLDKMNKEIEPIVGDFRVRGKLWEEEEDYSRPDMHVSYCLIFDGENDAIFFLQKRIEQWESRYEDVNIEKCEIAVLRRSIASIPEALAEIVGKLKELNVKYQEAIDKLAEMMAGFQK